MTLTRRAALAASLAVTATFAFAPETATAASGAAIREDAETALRRLLAGDAELKQLADKAVGILIFPDIVKAGLLVGGSYGEGALFKGGAFDGYYRTVAASFGLQAGAQKYGYAMFFMNDAALDYLKKSDGWEIGSGPSVVALDEGWATRASSTTLQEDVLVSFFDQSGLMAGLGLEGSKLTKFTPE